MSFPLFQITDLNFCRVGPDGNRHVIFQNAQILIPGGRVFTVAGPSGSGKSTFLRFLNRLGTPDSGTLRYQGADLSLLPVTHLRTRVAMLFQLPTLPEETVRDSLLFGPRLHKKHVSEERLHQWMTDVGLNPSLLDRPPSQLSIGQQQRASLVRLLANDPEVLLLDEPTSHLDEESARLIEEEVLSLVGQKKIEAIWVTHDRHQAERLGGISAVIEGGGIRCTK